MSLIDKLKNARQFAYPAEDGHSYTLRRPTDAEAAAIGSATALDLVKRFVVSWDHTELSLGIPGGSPTPAEFSPELWADWVADQPHLWSPLSTAIIDAYRRHVESREAVKKN